MKNYWTQSEENIFVAAHRGFSAKYPENTMPAFRAAIDLGVDQIETDVRITKDGVLVLVHDGLVDRTSNGTGVVHDMTLAELRELDFGSWKGEEFKGEKIVTLTELFELVKDLPDITLDLELKEYAPACKADIAFDACDRVLKIVDDYGFTDRIVINTFSGALQEYIQDKYGSRYRRHVYYPISYLGALKRDPYADGAYCCCMFRTLYSPINIASRAEFEHMHSLGIEPWAGAGVKDMAGVDMAIERGATLITCNNPDVVLECLRERGYHK